MTEQAYFGQFSGEPTVEYAEKPFELQVSPNQWVRLGSLKLAEDYVPLGDALEGIVAAVPNVKGYAIDRDIVTFYLHEPVPRPSPLQPIETFDVLIGYCEGVLRTNTVQSLTSMLQRVMDTGRE